MFLIRLFSSQCFMPGSGESPSAKPWTSWLPRRNFASGFTLIEILVVLAILVVIAVVFSSSFFAMLGGTNKAQVAAEVKQNGDYAMSVMVQTIRNARSTPSCSLSSTSVTITNPDWSQTAFACIDIGGITLLTSGPPGSEATNLPLISNQVRVEACNFDCLPERPPNPGGVKITLTLAENLPGITPRAQELSRQTFETTVFPRSYQ